MKLYDLLKKIYEENEEIIKSSENAYREEKELLSKIESLFSAVEKEFKEGNLSEEEFKVQKNAIEIRKNERVKEIRGKVKQQSKYAEVLSGLRDSRAFIGNKMLLALLKTSTGKDWTLEEETIPSNKLESNHPISTLNLVLKNNAGEKFVLQKGFCDDRFGPEYARSTFSNKNWFQEFLCATKNDGKVYLTALGGNGLEMPQPVVNALCDFFKKVDVDPTKPEALTFEDTRKFGEEETFKPHNLYYRYMRDKKKQAQKNANEGQNKENKNKEKN